MFWVLESFALFTLQDKLGNNSDVMFGSDYSSLSVSPPDHIGCTEASLPHYYSVEMLITFVGFDLCVLASSDHTIITYGIIY